MTPHLRQVAYRRWVSRFNRVVNGLADSISASGHSAGAGSAQNRPVVTNPRTLVPVNAAAYPVRAPRAVPAPAPRPGMIAKIVAAKGFWGLSDWLFDPFEAGLRRWHVILACFLSGVLVAAAIFASGRLEPVWSLATGVPGALAPLVAYAVLRAAISAVTAVALLAVYVVLVSGALAATAGGLYGLYLVSRLLLG
jgi:hypothetical protein